MSDSIIRETLLEVLSHQQNGFVSVEAIRAMEAAIEDLPVDNDEQPDPRDAEIARLRGQLAEQDKTIGRLKMKLEQRETYITDSHVDLCKYVNSAGDVVDRLRAEIQRKNEALEPFARYAKRLEVVGFGDSCPVTTDPSVLVTDLTVGDLRRARAALAELEGR